MKVKEFIQNPIDDMVTVKIYAGGKWQSDGCLVAEYMTGKLINKINGYLTTEYSDTNHFERNSHPIASIMESEITSLGVDGYKSIIIECDAQIDGYINRMKGMEFTKMLTLSTVHITRRTYEKLSKDHAGVAAYRKVDPIQDAEFGLFVYVDETIGWEDVPDDLKLILRLALEQGCGIICFDGDGPEIENCPTYRSTWD